MDLYARQGGNVFKEQAARMVFLPTQPAGASVCPTQLLDGLTRMVLVPDGKDKDGNVKVRANWDNPLLGGPFDGTDDEGKPLIESSTRDTVLRRLFPAAFAAEANQPPAAQNPPAPPK
jgi:hypothetical protein